MKKTNKKNKRFYFCFIIIPFISTSKGAQHPNLLLTTKGVKEIKASVGKYPDFDSSVKELRVIADNALISDIVVPIPKDEGGGYTHEKHKKNYYEMHAAGILYQITGKTQYAEFVHMMLLKYSSLYPILELHPSKKSDAPGKLFWQLLNDCVWLFHTAIAYDCIYDFLGTTDRAYIEKNLFYPMAEFISNGNVNNNKIFNKMHNHATWATASVGMIGYVLGDKDLIETSLYGSNKDGNSGYIRQLDVLFSPDGYYTEGPYYQRYAIWPFMVFAQVIQNNQPELNIFGYRDSILLKATNALVQCAYNGEIFLLNDALNKTYKTQEIVYAINIAFSNNSTNTALLDIARQQKSFIIADAGIITAKSLNNVKYKPFPFKSLLLRDGQNGEEGGLGIIRAGDGDKQTCVTFKATSHGLSHGHYDKLSIVLYDNGNCILPDYGAVRFLNIEPKNGGHYTKENYSWAMQTIAHNTIVVDETSHFDADINVSSNYHSNIQFYDFSDPTFQIICGYENNAYKKVKMQRTIVVLNNKIFQFPILIDIFRVNSDSIHTLDLPFHYQGQIISTNFNCKKNTTQLKPLGAKNGYQHLWVDATAKTQKTTTSFTWVNGNRFYTISTLSNSDTHFLMTHAGANDPDFNLRDEPCFLIRQPKVENHTFVSIIEPHGLYDLCKEVTENYQTTISNIEILFDNKEYTAIKISTINNKAYLLITLNSNFGEKNEHVINLNNHKIQFIGNYYFSELIK